MSHDDLDPIRAELLNLGKQMTVLSNKVEELTEAIVGKTSGAATKEGLGIGHNVYSLMHEVFNIDDGLKKRVAKLEIWQWKALGGLAVLTSVFAVVSEIAIKLIWK